MRTNTLALSIGLSVGFGFTFPGAAMALPPIGPAFPADAPVPVQEDKWVYDIGVASAGEHMLTIFEDGGNIRGMLTDPAGNALLGEMPFYVEAPVDGWNTKPSVAFGGSQYLIAYSATPGILVLRVGADGAAVDEPIVLSETGYSPSIGWVGDKFIIAWYESDGIGTEVATTTVSTAGTVGETQIVSVGTAGEPFLAANVNGALVAWVTHSTYETLGVEAVLLDTDGEIRVPEFFVDEGGSAWRLRVATSGDDFLAAWTHATGVRAVAVSRDGSPSAVMDLAEGQDPGSIALGANADGYLAAWRSYSDEASWTFRHIDANRDLGELGTSPNFVSSNDLTLLGKEGGYWAVYRDAGVFGALTDSQLAPVTDPTPLSLVQNSQDASQLFWNGTQYVLIWSDERFGDWTFNGRMVRVNTAGERRDADSVSLDDDVEGGSWYPAVPLAGGKTLIGWIVWDSGHMFVRVVNADGTTEAPIDLGVAGSRGGVTLAVHGQQRLAVYSGEGDTMWGQLFDADGARLGVPRRLPVSAGTSEVRAHSSADGFLIQVGDGTGTGLAALHDDWTLGPVQHLDTGSFPVDVANGAGKTVVVWSHHDNVRVARFWSDEGWAGDEFTLGNDAMWGDVTWDGTRFAAVWQDADYHSHWTTFDLEGNVAVPEALFSDECIGPLLASNGEGQCLLSCIRYNRDYSRRIVNYMVESGAIADPTDEASSPSNTEATTEANRPTTDTTFGGEWPTADVASTRGGMTITTELNPISGAEDATSLLATSGPTTAALPTSAAESKSGAPAPVATDEPRSSPATHEPTTTNTGSESLSEATADSRTMPTTDSTGQSGTSTDPTTTPPRPTRPTCAVSPVSNGGSAGGVSSLILVGLALTRRTRRRA